MIILYLYALNLKKEVNNKICIVLEKTFFLQLFAFIDPKLREEIK